MPVIRPARTTTRLQIPIPGDAGPADFVTDLGAAADRIDVATPPPLITPAELSQPPYTTPYDGQTIDMMVDSAAGVVWRLRYTASISADDCKWMFVGGLPLIGYDTSISTGLTVNTLNRWLPVLSFPRQGFYHVETEVTLGSPAGSTANVYSLVTDPSNTNLYAQARGSQVLLPAGTLALCRNMGRTALTTALNVAPAIHPGPTASVTARASALSITPIRVR